MERKKRQGEIRVGEENPIRPWLNKAEELARRCNLLGQLNITHPIDIEFFLSHFAARLLRAKVYDNTKQLNPFSYKTIVSSLTRSQYSDAELVNTTNEYNVLSNLLDENNQNFLKERYLSEEERNRAHAIELAVNSLCSHAIIFDEERVRSYFEPSKRLLKDWSDIWRDQVRHSTQDSTHAT